IATRNAIFIAPPEASVIPSAAFSGILSITDPMNNDLPEGGLPSMLALLSVTRLPLMTWFLTFSPVLHLQRRTKYPLIGNQLWLQSVYELLQMPLPILRTLMWQLIRRFQKPL